MASTAKWIALLEKRLLQNNFVRYCSRTPNTDENEPEEEEFRVLNIKPPERRNEKKRGNKINLPPPRTQKMKYDQDWTTVWPGPRTFHPAVVPLPVRQSCNKNGEPLTKYGNAELMKIPNFLHLTPPAIERHCEALKKFCTPWPETLKTDEEIEKHFPIEIITSDYCHSSPSIRNPLSRIISLKVKLANLELDYHAKDKFLRLVGPRYDPKTDYVTITTDSCPLKKQNYEYAHYLLTALIFESWKNEEWEKEKSNDDMEKYIFSKRQSFENVKHLFEYKKKEMPDLKEFAEAVENWHNEGDSADNIAKYKEAALKLLSLST